MDINDKVSSYYHVPERREALSSMSLGQIQLAGKTYLAILHYDMHSMPHLSQDCFKAVREKGHEILRTIIDQAIQSNPALLPDTISLTRLSDQGILTTGIGEPCYSHTVLKTEKLWHSFVALMKTAPQFSLPKTYLELIDLSSISPKLQVATIGQIIDKLKKNSAASSQETKVHLDSTEIKILRLFPKMTLLNAVEDTHTLNIKRIRNMDEQINILQAIKVQLEKKINE